MKICLDLRTVGDGRHGIARYGTELTRALQALGAPHHLILLTHGGAAPAGLGQSGASVLPCRCRPYSLQEQILVPMVVARLRPDIYHCPTYAFPAFVPVPGLFTIHDLLPLIYPKDFSLGLRLYQRSVVRWTARRARRIVAVSTYTRASICRSLPVNPGKVRVIPEGGEHVRRASASEEDAKAYREINPGGLDYFLTIANPRPHKNVLFSIRCFLESGPLHAGNVRYVLVGPQHPSVRAYARARDPEGRIRFAGEVSEGLLRLLYEQAVALVCPSRGEGFCLPAVEAMQFGLPVIGAQDGALPEVLGPAGLLFSPEDARGWQEALVSVHARRKKGDWDPSPVIERARLFTWARAAESTLALYEEIHNETHSTGA